jgi:hypothetical protein
MRLVRPTVERIRQLLEYHPDTGKFYRRDKTSGWNPDGSVGSMSSHGYIQVSVDSVSFSAIRLAWIYTYGYPPAGKYVSPINRDKTDSRISNIHLTDHPKRNRPGLQGAYRVRNPNAEKLWYSTINIGKQKIRLGYFTSEVEAHNAYMSAKTIYEQTRTLTIGKFTYKDPRYDFRTSSSEIRS